MSMTSKEKQVEDQWEKVRCLICMEPPHQAILLLCSSHKKGCRPYICDTGSNHSNCFSQFKISKTRKVDCPLCRGKVRDYTVDEPARRFMNLKAQSCASEGCEFSGKYVDLKKHVNLVHPSAGPSEDDDPDPIIGQKLRVLEDYVSQLESARLAMNDELRRLMISIGSVYGMEYGFGAHDYSISGVFEVEPRSCPGFIYRCSISLGHIDMSASEFREFIETMASDYHGDTYHLISKNCNHFTDDIHRLNCKRIPGWVNRLAKFGSIFSCLLPDSLESTTVKQLPEYHTYDDMSDSGSNSSSQEASENEEVDHKVLISPTRTAEVAFIKEIQR
ncbi:hypothetical protein L1987_31122 [Smallanthus sonchifolius]|uniref:Uncharacterized protein n=1 Tax=Smallanthus sonchifolius TaxID=185202 RepID=A0ACB9I658_9ASTR|nr:hypothetical protein L1987_31122 [Smallanthus sonchifolius]